MAQIVIKAIDAVTDSTVDKRGCYKYGMPVDCQFESGKKINAGFPLFMVCDCHDVKPDDIRWILEPLDAEWDGSLDEDGQPVPPETVTRKRYAFDLESLPAYGMLYSAQVMPVSRFMF
ncbi:hypothetical protein THIOSC15_990004 [uncultured Thiomicrorhabdus sp.]